MGSASLDVDWIDAQKLRHEGEANLVFERYNLEKDDRSPNFSKPITADDKAGRIASVRSAIDDSEELHQFSGSERN